MNGSGGKTGQIAGRQRLILELLAAAPGGRADYGYLTCPGLIVPGLTGLPRVCCFFMTLIDTENQKMLFELMAPIYDWFVKVANIDHSGKMPEWLAPVKDKEILDLGGGTGVNSRTLAAAGARVTVADFSQAMLNRAATKKVPARLIRADAASLPLPDDSFDIVLISDAWHHFRDHPGVVREVARVLRPNGRLYIIDFDPGKRKTRFLAILERLVAEPSTFTPPDKLVEMFLSAGIQGNYRYLTSNQFIYAGVKS